MDASTDAPDLLRGLPAVARHLGITLRQARHWHDTGVTPTFLIGGLVCARKSTITAWLVAEEARALHKGKGLGAHRGEVDAA